MKEIVPCRCGKSPRFWRFGDIYLCGCINPNCTDVYPVRSPKSKEDVIKRWNEKMKGERSGEQK